MTDIEHGQSLFLQAHAAYEAGNPGLGGRYLDGALRVSRDVPGAWYRLGLDAIKAKDSVAAIAAFRRVLELMPGEPFSLTNLGWQLFQAGRYHESHLTLLKAIEAAPDKPLAYANMSRTLVELGEARQAAVFGKTAVQIDPEDAHARLAYAFALLADGQFAEGLKQSEARFAYKMPDMLNYPMPMWRGEAVGKLLIVAEQGLGDTVMFARFIKMAFARVGRLNVVIAAQKELISWMERGLGPCGGYLPMPAAIPEAEAFIPMVSLPVALGLSDAEIVDVPPLDGDAGLGPRHDFKTRRKKVGVVWAGSPEQDNDRYRSMPDPRVLLGLYSVPGIELFSFQVGKRAYELEPIKHLITDLSGEIRSISDTGRLLRQMDAVVTVCTSVAHIAGSVGVPTFVALPAHGAYWVWGQGEALTATPTPWYPSVYSFRQEKVGDWDPVVNEIAGALEYEFSPQREAEKLRADFWINDALQPMTPEPVCDLTDALQRRA